MKTTKYIAGLITILGTTWLNAQINPGANNLVQGVNSSVAGGDLNRVSSLSADAIIGSGLRNTNHALCGTIGGGKWNMVYTDFSTIPGGKSAHTLSYGQMAYASGGFTDPSPGDAQFSLYVLRGMTVGAETRNLALDGNSEYIIVPSNGSFLFDIDIVCRSATTNNTPWYGNFFHYRIAVEEQGATLPLHWDLMDFSKITNHNSSVTATFDAVGSAFLIKGTGESGQTIHWVATVKATELVKP